jgi:hypothetical protein
MRAPEAAAVLVAVGVFGLLLAAAGYGLTLFEPQPNRGRTRSDFRAAAAGAVAGGAAGLVIDLALGLREWHVTGWLLTVGPLVGVIYARRRGGDGARPA